ncbi:hypothetical protein GBA65_07175 [Rubrobacter marinus]|uniref:Tetratricopeptide repeat protein n=1 Tax=Rubrobacter marinus TaxID=2653852 RepID=A0A6G8PVY6_9ACTN|nr:hypothetical protein [Rubrobacter marinus]QIN78335.1 hypothetical protein GBA65_07175 [Rubrobacter marinus]
MLEPNRKQIRKELDEARRMMGFEEQRYGRAFAATLERAARCLYWLHDSEAREYLLRTIESYGQNRQMIGNFYRMLGEQELSRRHFGQAFGGFKERLNEDDFMSVAATAEAAFLAGDYEEAERLADRYRELDPDPGLRIHAVGKLARARRTGDLRVSEEAAEELAEMIRKSRAKVSDTGNVNLWDWYELALETGVQSERGEGPAAVADEVGGVVRRGNAAGTGGPDLQERDLRERTCAE